MKTLFFTQEEQKSIFDNWYNSIVENIGDCTLVRVPSNDQKNLKRFVEKNKLNLKQYDRVILFLRYKKMMRQVNFIQSIPNLVIIELDACQNYCESKYNGRFSTYFNQIPWARILCTGKELANRLQNEGFDAQFFSKAYDNTILSNLNLKRNIELAFVGSLQTGVYQYRKAFLEEVTSKEKLKIIKTKPGQEYLNTLNQIKYFVSADIPFGEYMIKNFEAMACGCVLFTWDQGEVENKALGFIDMHNVVLYKTIDDFQEKLNIIRNNDSLGKEIALNGQKLVQDSHTWSHAAKKITQLIEPSLREKTCIKSLFGLKKTYKLKK